MPMKHLAVVVLLLLVMQATAQPEPCPYTAYTSTGTQECFNVDNPRWSVYCVIDNTCKGLKTFSSSDVGLDASQQATLIVRDEPVSFVADLPNKTQNLRMQFSNASIRSIGDLSWATTVTYLEIVDNATPLDLSKTTWPPNLTQLSITKSRVSSFPAMTIQPTSVTMEDNNITSLENHDFRRSVQVTFAGNPVTKLLNVSFGTSLKSLDLGNGVFTTFTVDAATYAVLTNKSLVLTLSKSINVAASCEAPNSLKPLLPTGADPTIFTVLAASSVCVTPNSMLPVVSTPAPTMSPATDMKTASGISGGAVAGIVVGVVAVVAAIGMFFFKRSRTSTTSKETAYQQTHDADGTTTAMFQSSAAAPSNFEALALLRLDNTQLVQTAFLAEGAFGQVWVGTYQGQAVAIKALLPGKGSRTAIGNLADEILLASTMQSPYVVQLIGASWRIPSELQMVLEWMDRGDLRSVLQKSAPSTPHEASSSFSWDEKIECMRCMAEGLTYLHSMDIIHRDLKSRNVLLDSTKGTKLTDFGASREATTETMTVGVGTYRWMAPEILQENHYSTAADIFSFGMVLSELSTHEIPYFDQTNEKGQLLVDTAIMGRVMQGSIMPTFGKSTPSWVVDLGLACIARTPEDRPTAMQVAHTIRQYS